MRVRHRATRWGSPAAPPHSAPANAQSSGARCYAARDATQASLGCRAPSTRCPTWTHRKWSILCRHSLTHPTLVIEHKTSRLPPIRHPHLSMHDPRFPHIHDRHFSTTGMFRYMTGIFCTFDSLWTDFLLCSAASRLPSRGSVLSQKVPFQKSTRKRRRCTMGGGTIGTTCQISISRRRRGE